MKDRYERSRKLPYIVLTILMLFNLAWMPNLIPSQQDVITPTVDSEITATSLSTQTLFLQDTETLTAISNNEIATPTPSGLVAEAVPVNDQSLGGDFASDEVLIRFRGDVSKEAVDQCVQSVNAVIVFEIEVLSVYLLKVQVGKIAEAMFNLQACPDIYYAEPNYMAFSADTIPSDSNWNLQYGLVNIRAPQGWDYDTGSTTVTIAIIDTGVDLSHADLAGKIVPGYDFVNNDTIAQDDNGHGTHVAGVAAASGNNGIGVAGVSWGARIMPVKVLNAGGGGSFAEVAAGITWAADHGAHVINLSLGGASTSAVLQDAVNYAYGKGVVLVAAAGNTGSGVILYPARYPNVIAVGAVDNTNTHAGFSNYGPELDLVAPGAFIYSTTIGGYGYNSGTSMAAPYVAGLAAILRGYPAGYSPDAIAFEMGTTALDLGISGIDNLYGYGLIQMDSAIQSVYITPTPTITLMSIDIQPATHQVFQNQVILPIQSSTPTWTPTSTPSPTPSITVTHIELSMQTLLPSDISPRQATTATSELNALSTPQTQGRLPRSTHTSFCLGVVLILLGLLLFRIAGRKRNQMI